MCWCLASLGWVPRFTGMDPTAFPRKLLPMSPNLSIYLFQKYGAKCWGLTCSLMMFYVFMRPQGGVFAQVVVKHALVGGTAWLTGTS